jgi:SAM-dependent methyltransferase
LQEARRKLGKRGIYLLADITALPLRDGVVDASVSLHTVYHVPADEQRKALLELHRVLKPGGESVVVYSWGARAPLMRATMWPFRAARGMRDLLRTLVGGGRPPAPPLYFHCHPYSWFASQDWPFELDVRVWRSLSVPCLQMYVHRWLFGRGWLAMLYGLEERFPRMAGRLGQYPAFILRKARD